MLSNKNKCNEMHDEYVDDNININNLIKENEKEDKEYFKSKNSNIIINCNMNIEFDTKNKMMYLFPNKLQYFMLDVPKFCGDITVKSNECYKDKGIPGNLGIYYIVKSIIAVKAYGKLDPKKNDILSFTLIDESTKKSYDFDVVFSCK